jgi:phage terminase large subunit-like protein
MFVGHSGYEILVKSEESGEQKYQADDWAWVWKDEAGDAKAEGVYNEIIRGLADSNGPIFITMTPTLGSSWIGPRLYEPWNSVAHDESGREVDGVSFFFANTEDNIHLSRAGLRSFVSMQVTDAQKAVRLRGRFVVLEGLVYSMFEERRHVIPSFPIPAEWRRWRSMDWGLVAPSTCLWGALEPANDGHPERLHIYREVYDTRIGKTISMTSATIKEASGEESYVQTLLDPTCWNRDPAPDSVGGYFIVADEYARCGVFAERYNNEVEAGVERIWRYFGAPGAEPLLLVHDCCPMLIHELKHQRWKRNTMGLSASSGVGMGDKIEKSDSDHALDPLRGMVMAGMLEGASFYGPDRDPFNAQIEDAGTRYGWKLVDGQAVLVSERGPATE